MPRLYERFDRLDTRMNQWLVTHSIPFLRVSLGAIFLGFGALKFFPDLSPVEGLVTRVTALLTFGLIPDRLSLIFLAGLECAIGLCFITGVFLRVAVWLMGVQLLGAMSPLIFFPGELFPGPLHAPTLAAQYVIKDVVLLAVGLLLAATWTGAQLVPESRSMRSTLRTRPLTVGAGEDRARAAGA